MAEDQQIKNLRMGMDIVIKSVPQVIRVLNSEKDEKMRDEIINDLRSTISAYIEREKEYQNSIDALATARLQIHEQVESQEQDPEYRNSNQVNSIDVDKIFQEAKSKLPKQASSYINKHAKMKEFESKVVIELQNMLGSGTADTATGTIVTQDDDGEVVATETVSTIDPITRKEMTDPVKNTLCGHTYERSSITQLININSKQKCPMAGCANKNPVTLNHLIANSDVLKLIQQNSRKK